MKTLILKNKISCSSFLILLVLFVISCGDSGKKGGAPYETFEKSAVTLKLQTAGADVFDSLVITGSGADTIHISVRNPEIPVQLELLPHPNWVFHGKLYALKGELVQEGFVEFEVESGKSHHMTLALRALVGFFHFEIPLGLTNPLGIESGTLRIQGENTDTILSLQKENAYAYFTSGILALNQTYRIEMKLYNTKEDLLYALEETFLLDPENPVPQWEIPSLYGAVSLSVKIDAVDFYRVTAPLQFPGSTQRHPVSGDLIITEIMANPKTNGDEFKYIEVYNGSLDTLLLNDCIIGSGSGTTTGNKIPAGTQVLPTSFFVIGGDSVNAANIRTGKFTLTGSGQTLVFHCEKAVIDSIAYGSKSDSLGTAIPVAAGKSTQLPLSYWPDKHDGSRWCYGNEPFYLGETLLYGTPGKDANCNPQ
ncbi:MAG: lamin tail domain-containing protein [Fibrobacter sp.]|jgi:hypothetical protein|nr:lamin tail domain-containing protein [Fibrobacter sp.]